MQPNTNITTTTNQYLAPAWVDQVLRDNFFFGQVMEKVKRWDGSQMLFPIKYQKGLASVAFSGFDVLPITQQPTTVNAVFYPLAYINGGYKIFSDIRRNSQQAFA